MSETCLAESVASPPAPKPSGAGLSEDEALRRRAVWGPNEVTQSARIGPIRQIAKERATAPDILVLATRNGAQAMGRLKDFGTLEAGKLADLLILAEDPRVDVRAFRSLTHVMRGGRLYGQAVLAQRR